MSLREQGDLLLGRVYISVSGSFPFPFPTSPILIVEFTSLWFTDLFWDSKLMLAKAESLLSVVVSGWPGLKSQSPPLPAPPPAI